MPCRRHEANTKTRFDAFFYLFVFKFLYFYGQIARWRALPNSAFHKSNAVGEKGRDAEIRFRFKLREGHTENGAANQRHVRREALFHREALLSEQHDEVSVYFEKLLAGLDFAANQIRARSIVGSQKCNSGGRFCAAVWRRISVRISVFNSFTFPTKETVTCKFSFGVTLPPSSFSRSESDALKRASAVSSGRGRA